MRGTKSQNFQTIFDKLESAGASLGFGASVHNTSFSGRSLAEDLPLTNHDARGLFAPSNFPAGILRPFTGSITHKPFNPRARYYRNGRHYLRSTSYLATIPTARPGRRFHRDHPKDHPHQPWLIFTGRYYHPKNLVIVVVGAVEAQPFFDVIEAVAGRLAKPGADPTG